MEWIIPIALSIMILNETERGFNVRGTNRSMGNSEFPKHHCQPDSVSCVSEYETVGGQSRNAGKRTNQNKNKTGDSV